MTFSILVLQVLRYVFLSLALGLFTVANSLQVYCDRDLVTKTRPHDEVVEDGFPSPGQECVEGASRENSSDNITSTSITRKQERIDASTNPGTGSESTNSLANDIKHHSINFNVTHISSALPEPVYTAKAAVEALRAANLVQLNDTRARIAGALNFDKPKIEHVKSYLCKTDGLSPGQGIWTTTKGLSMAVQFGGTRPKASSANKQVSPSGTTVISLFVPTLWKETPNATQTNAYQSIPFMRAYQKYSFEELRLLDSSAGQDFDAIIQNANQGVQRVK
jgi:hypothetical protein